MPLETSTESAARFRIEREAGYAASLFIGPVVITGALIAWAVRRISIAISVWRMKQQAKDLAKVEAYLAAVTAQQAREARAAREAEDDANDQQRTAL